MPKLTETEDLRLRHAIADEACEAAYRRGFQQGHHAAQKNQRLAVDIYTWRFGQRRSRNLAVWPHSGHREPADRRHFCEPGSERLLALLERWRQD